MNVFLRDLRWHLSGQSNWRTDSMLWAVVDIPVAVIVGPFLYAWALLMLTLHGIHATLGWLLRKLS